MQISAAKSKDLGTELVSVDNKIGKLLFLKAVTDFCTAKTNDCRHKLDVSEWNLYWMQIKPKFYYCLMTGETRGKEI